MCYTPKTTRNSGNSSSATTRRDYRKLHAKLKPVVMWDGEGITENGTHQYIMLCNSRRNCLESDQQLETCEIFEFLCRYGGGTGVINIGYGIGYDVAMWLLPLSRLSRIELLNGRIVDGRELIALIYRNTSRAPVTFSPGAGTSWYGVSYRARKQFTVRIYRQRPRYRQAVVDVQSRQHDSDGAFVLWDVWGFYQSPFVQALEKNSISVDVDTMSNMKARRSVFARSEIDEIREYCFRECEAGVLLYKQTLSECVEADIMPSRHDGPGALAAALLKREGVKNSLELEPGPVRLPVACAYFGGRIELLALGSFERLCGYDIASAYPAQIQHLPCLVGGEWVQGRRDGATLCLYRVRYEYDRGLAFYPLPYRCPNGSVVFAAEGEGWYWDVEVRAAQEWEERFGQESCEIVDCWSFIGACEKKPFAFVPELFELRKRWVAEGRGGEKIIKLALNSCYGKLAQQLGGSLEALPPYFSLVWAGLITAGTRAALLRAACAARDPQSVVAFMTDGLYVREELDIPVAKKTLGEWEPPDVYDEAVFVQAGVYWTRQDGEWKARYRGFDKKAMETPELVVHAWRAGNVAVDVPVTRFASFGAALMSRDLWERRATWVETTRTLDVIGTCVKREPNMSIFERAHVNLRVNINIAYTLDKRISSPYDAITISTQDKAESLTCDDSEEMYL